MSPEISISPSSAMRMSAPATGLPIVPNRCAVGLVERPDPGRLGHAPALHHGDAAGVEEPQDLRRDRRGTGDRQLDVRPRRCSARARTARCRRARTRRRPLPTPPRRRDERRGPLPELDRRRDGLPILGRDHRRRRGVHLLEDARHRRQALRPHLAELGDDASGSPTPVGDRSADLERRRLHELGEHVGQRQVQVDDAPAPKRFISTPVSPPAAKPSFVSTTPFGRPVVPDV